MKQNRSTFLIILSSLALVIVLVIQLNWILETARIKEELFNEKANMVLSRTTEALSADPAICKGIESFVTHDGITGQDPKLGNREIRTIDSLLTQYMDFYNFHIDYSFEVRPASFKAQQKAAIPFKLYTQPAGYYQKNITEVAGKNGFELKLHFPEKKQFILAEMGTLFITSVILILVVLFMFWRTVLSLTREKKIAGHTKDFLNNMTHEFKTPLTNIALAGKMIIKGSNGKQEDKTKHYSEIILEENEKLRLQVEQVLSMTAFERGEIPLQRTELDLHQLIARSVRSMDLQVQNKQGELTVNLRADRSVVTGDQTHLTNAICNLIDNAIKYSGEKAVLSIQTSNIGQDVLVKISDQGIGIKKEYQKQVFDKFFRVPTGDVHDVKGFGLGLAYVKKIIELHGGTIALDSEKGKGSTFTITLPHG